MYAPILRIKGKRHHAQTFIGVVCCTCNYDPFGPEQKWNALLRSLKAFMASTLLAKSSACDDLSRHIGAAAAAAYATFATSKRAACRQLADNHQTIDRQLTDN